jgi:membrane associated rhomboid family serine protease
VPYLAFYLLAATGAVALQVATDPDSVIPMIGASGAIAGVLGAYLVLYPRATVAVLLPFFFFIPLPVPAFVLLIFWFALQLFIGIASIGMSEASQGVAVWAHVGGFVTGLILIVLLRPFIRRRPYRRSRKRQQMY